MDFATSRQERSRARYQHAMTPAPSQGIYLLDVKDGAIGRADEDGAVVIDVNDLDVEHGGPPERGMSLVRGHHGQVEPLVGLQAPPGHDEPRVFIDLESLCGQKKHISGSGHFAPDKLQLETSIPAEAHPSLVGNSCQEVMEQSQLPEARDVDDLRVFRASLPTVASLPPGSAKGPAVSGHPGCISLLPRLGQGSGQKSPWVSGK